MIESSVETLAVTHAHDLAELSGSTIRGQRVQRVGVNPAWLSLRQARSVLLLQGPLGPFFDRLSVWMRSLGIQVNRVVFQGGDELDCQALTPIRFAQPITQWPYFLRQKLKELGVDHIVLFGQSRDYHALAREVASQVGVKVVVMEEGYFRPGFATMELDGVNGYSTTLQRFNWEPGFTDGGAVSLPPALAKDIQPDVTPHHFQKMAWHASQHYLAMRRARPQYLDYCHHKNDNPYWYAKYWVKSWCKKIWFSRSDRVVQSQLIGNSQPYFLVPLQHDGDAQIAHHSCFNQNTDFIIQVMRSFAQHASAGSLLVFRQHPHSRGGAGHAQFIQSLARELHITQRVLHLVEGDTPLLAQHSAGVVLINSTVGLQALERGAPLIVLGDALYKQRRLSFWAGLDLFWCHCHKPEPEPTRLFLAQIKNLTQIPVSLYATRSEPLVWA